MSEFTPALLPPVWISADTVAPWMAIFIYAFLAGLPRLLAWLLDASRSWTSNGESAPGGELNS